MDGCKLLNKLIEERKVMRSNIISLYNELDEGFIEDIDVVKGYLLCFLGNLDIGYKEV